MQQMQSNMDSSWICNLCLLATFPVDLSFSSDLSESDTSGRHNDLLLCKPVPEIVQRKKKLQRNSGDAFNVNSLQNKIEEVKMLIEQFKAQVVFLEETKIDGSYPDNQFAISNYHIYRNDRVKGGGLMVSFSKYMYLLMAVEI